MTFYYEMIVDGITRGQLAIQVSELGVALAVNGDVEIKPIAAPNQPEEYPLLEGRFDDFLNDRR